MFRKTVLFFYATATIWCRKLLRWIDAFAGRMHEFGGMDRVVLLFLFSLTLQAQVVLDTLQSNRPINNGNNASCSTTSPLPGRCLWFEYDVPRVSLSVSGGQVTDTIGNTEMDMEFFPATNGVWAWSSPCLGYPNGTCSFLQGYIQGGTWSPTLNRMKFQFKCNVSAAYNSPNLVSAYPIPLLQVGTYIRPHAGVFLGGSPYSTQGHHYYHNFNFSYFANQWQTIVVNQQPQHANTSPGGNDSLSNDPEWNSPIFTDTGGRPLPVHYFDGMTTFYFQDISSGQGMIPPGNPNSALSNATCKFTNFTLYQQNNEPDTWVSNIEGAYDAVNSQYELNWNAPKMVPLGTNYVVRYSASQSLKTLGFSNGSPLGNVSGLSDSNYTAVHAIIPGIAKANTLYVGIRPQMVIGSLNAATPPVATMLTPAGQNPSVTLFHHLTDGDQVTIAGVSGAGAPNGNYYARVLSPTTFTLYLDAGMTKPASGGTFSCPAQCTVTATSNTTNFTEFVVQDPTGSTPPPPSNKCDVNGDGVVNISDVQQAINAALGLSPCTADPNGDGRCDAVDVQIIINTALGGTCP